MTLRDKQYESFSQDEIPLLVNGYLQYFSMSMRQPLPDALYASRTTDLKVPKLGIVDLANSGSLPAHPDLIQAIL